MPGSRWISRGIVLEFGLFLGSVVALQGSRFVYTLLVAAGLEPAAFTGWTLFITFVGYAPAMLLGASNGMNRIVPILLGGGRDEDADDAEAATWAVVALAVSIALAAGLILAFATDPLVWAVAIAGCLTAVYQVQQFAMRARLGFNRASYQQFVWACCLGLACVAIVLIGASLANAIALWIVGLAAGVIAGYGLHRPVWRSGSIRVAGSLVVKGMPIMLAGLAGNLFYTADRWVASATLDAPSAGAYGLASLVASAAFLVPTVIAQQQYPRLAMLHGSGAPIGRIEGAVRRQGLVAAGGALLTAIGIAVFAAVVIPAYLPAYTAATAPTIILCLGLVALAASTGYANAMVVMGALWRYLAVQCFCLTAAIALMFLGATIIGAPGIAIGAAAGQALLLIGVSVAGRATLRQEARVL